MNKELLACNDYSPVVPRNSNDKIIIKRNKLSSGDWETIITVKHSRLNLITDQHRLLTNEFPEIEYDYS